MRCRGTIIARYARLWRLRVIDRAIEAMAGLDGILSGKRDRWQLIYNGGERWRERDYEISFHRIAVGGERFITRHSP